MADGVDATSSGRPKVGLDPDEPALDGFRRVLTRLAATIDDHVGPTVADDDPEHLHELRVAVRTATRPEAEMARRAITQLATAGPVGTAIGPPPPVRKVVALWPTLVPRSVVPVRTDVVVAQEAFHARA